MTPPDTYKVAPGVGDTRRMTWRQALLAVVLYGLPLLAQVASAECIYDKRLDTGELTSTGEDCPVYRRVTCPYGTVNLYPASEPALGAEVQVLFKAPGLTPRPQTVRLPASVCAPSGAVNYSLYVRCPGTDTPRYVGHRWWWQPLRHFEVCK